MIDLYFRDHLVYKELRLPLILGRSPKYGSYVHQCNGGREENPNLLRSKGQGQKSPNQFFSGQRCLTITLPAQKILEEGRVEVESPDPRFGFWMLYLM